MEVDEIEDWANIDKFYYIPEKKKNLKVGFSSWFPSFSRNPEKAVPENSGTCCPRKRRKPSSTQCSMLPSWGTCRGENILLQHLGQGEENPSHLPEGGEDN